MDRLHTLRIFLVIGLLALFCRLFYLQALRGSYYRGLAEQNRMRVVPDPPPRGLILDRRGRVLAANRTVYRIAVIPQEVEDLDLVLNRVSELVGQPVEKLRARLKKEQTLVFMPATIVPDAPKQAALELEEERWRLPGLLIRPEPIRHYPLGRTAAHLLGYLSQPKPDDLPLLKRYGIRPRTLIGRTGLEELLDPVLRGEAGGRMVEVNHRGRQVRLVADQEARPGEPVTLTIDAALQSLVEDAFGASPGAAVVLDPETGAVLAMASSPGYSPEAFVRADSDELALLFKDPENVNPLMNRATLATYPPGSIAKLVVGAAALEAGVITPQTTFECHGGLQIGDRMIHCWNRDGHGTLDLPHALMHSCNVYFMHTGLRLGKARLMDAYSRTGFGRPTEWPLPERKGQLPQKRLTEGEVAMFAFGQTVFECTPLQAAVMAASFANGGALVQPWVIQKIGGRQMKPPPMRGMVGWSKETLERIREGMHLVVHDPEGTGRRANTPRVTVAGKTGTAQTHKPGLNHAWFAGFCPEEHPRAAIAVIAEFGGSGGDLPTEIGRTICEYVALPETL